MKFVVKRIDRISVDRLQSVVSNSIERITYNEALDALKKVKFSLIVTTTLVLLCCEKKKLLR